MTTKTAAVPASKNPADLMEDLTAQVANSDKRPIADRVHDLITGKIEGKVEIHKAANLFPMMDDEDSDGFTAMVEDIKKHGVNEPIMITGTGVVVDGRNRIAAIRRLIEGGKTPKFTVEVLDKSPRTIRNWVLSTNLHRRHLTTSQRSMIAAELTTATKASGAAARGKAKADVDHVTVDDAAKTMNVSPRSVKTAKAVKKADPAVAAEVKAGKTTLGKAKAKTTRKPAAKKGNPAPAKPTKAPAKPSTRTKRPGLTSDQLDEISNLFGKATADQLVGLQSTLRGHLKVANGETAKS